MQPRVLVLDGNQRASLAAVRSLGAKGSQIVVGEVNSSSMAGSSRFCWRSVAYTDPFSSPRGFFDDILRHIEALNISFVLPITETTTYVLLRYRDELPKNVILPLPPQESFDLLADKNRLFELAAKLDVKVPDTIFCQDLNQGLNALEKVDTYPVVLKPFKSKILHNDSVISTHVIIADTIEEARRALVDYDFFKFPYTIQSFVRGTGQGVFALFNHGEPICYFAHRRLREKPPGGGVSVLCESVLVNNELRASAEKLLRKANWHGVAMVEFRVCDDGISYLMEVNPRFWGSLQLAIDSGIDFPWWLYLASVDEAVPRPVWRHRRLRWLLGDLDRLYLVLKSSSTTYSNAEKFIEVLRFLKPGLRTQHEINRWQDLKPFWFELRQYLRALKSRTI